VKEKEEQEEEERKQVDKSKEMKVNNEERRSIWMKIN